MYKILVLGATGAMGAPLVRILSENDNYVVYGTSRKEKQDGKIKWIKGNAHDLDFMTETLKIGFDVVVDFMVYTTEELKQRRDLFLSNCKQYIFISSARVYAPTDDVITEESPRILDVCEDKDYIAKEMYDITKALQENILINSGYKNYTILRPSLTYNDDRLQFSIYEKDEWLYRALHNQSVLFPECMKSVKQTMTYGGDVAKLIAKLIMNDKALGEVFNVTCGQSMSWNEIFKIYADEFESTTGKKLKAYYDVDAEELSTKLNRYYQYIYARGISRVVSNEKINAVTGGVDYTNMTEGLKNCLHNFLTIGKECAKPISFRQVALIDRMAHEYSDLAMFDSFKQKIGYLMCRFGVNI